MALFKRILRRLSGTSYVRNALTHPVAISDLRRRPKQREWLGLGLMAFSYVIGWPAVAALVYLVYRLREPLVVIIGGPVIYGISHLVFLVGLWLAGADYSRKLLRFATRKGYERYLPEAIWEVGKEEGPKAGPEASPRTGPEVGSEAGPKAGPEVGPEATPKATPENVPESLPKKDDR